VVPLSQTVTTITSLRDGAACPDPLHIYIYELGPASFYPGMPRVVNACKPSPRSDTPSGCWLCD
jgi:hypothetical protein